MTDITNLVNYYVNLLIIQYHNQPKAQATIALFAKMMLINGVIFDVQNGYNIDTAVGVQLDVLGKYQDIDRAYSAFDPVDYFSLETYGETPPTTPPRYGFTDYADYASTPPNGCLLYSDIVATKNKLVDEAFRTLIYLRIIQNYSNYGGGDIDNRLFALFGTQIRMEDSGNMHMAYFIDSTVQHALVEAIIAKKVLPRPMGVGAIVVSDVSQLIFGMTDYYGSISPYGYGFSDYADYASLPGEVLIYDDITVT